MAILYLNTIQYVEGTATVQGRSGMPKNDLHLPWWIDATRHAISWQRQKPAFSCMPADELLLH